MPIFVFIKIIYMKRRILFFGLLLGFASCENYTKEQSEAADFMCDCMTVTDKDADVDVLYFGCSEEAENKFDKSVFSDEGYLKALIEKCPDNSILIGE